jgi:hypothetical protein
VAALNVELPFSEACERNKAPILERLASLLVDGHHVLEIGAGTGQHAVHFARALPGVTWQPTDRAEYLPGLVARIRAEGSSNLLPPLELDVNWSRWPAIADVNAAYTANTMHIMSWPEVQATFAGLGRVFAGSVHRPAAGLLIVYGPFRYGGHYTSDSNAAFDASLRERDPSSGIRDFEAVDALAAGIGFELLADLRLPANNQFLVWRQAAR